MVNSWSCFSRVIVLVEGDAMKTKIQERFVCEKCGGDMEVENTAKARYTLFVLWRCSCGYQHLEKRHLPVPSGV